MKKLILLLVVFCSAVTLFASNGNTTEDIHESIENINLQSDKSPADKMISKLELKTKLTAEQKESIKNMAKDYSFDGLSKTDRKTKRQEFRRNIFKNVLTDVQKEELKSKRN
jgi:hypothetical protein